MIYTETQKRIALRRIDSGDERDVIEILKNETIKKTYMIPDFKSEDEAIALFTRLKTFSERDDRFVRGVSLNGKLIGFVNDVMTNERKVELGYVIHPQYHNRGYATEALALAINAMYDKGFTEVIAGAFIENPASFRVMQKCGMTLTGDEEYIEYRGASHRCLYYSIKKVTV